MCLSYVLSIGWLLILCFLVVITLLTTISWFLCSAHRVQVEHQCIDLSQFGKLKLDLRTGQRKTLVMVTPLFHLNQLLIIIATYPLRQNYPERNPRSYFWMNFSLKFVTFSIFRFHVSKHDIHSSTFTTLRSRNQTLLQGFRWKSRGYVHCSDRCLFPSSIKLGKCSKCFYVHY